MPRGRPKKEDELCRRCIVRLRACGFAVSQIADIYGCSDTVVRYHLQQDALRQESSVSQPKRWRMEG